MGRRACSGVPCWRDVELFEGSVPEADSVLCAVDLTGAFLVWFSPETKGRPLPE